MDIDSLKANYSPSHPSLESSQSNPHTHLSFTYSKFSSPISVSQPKLHSSLFSKHIQYQITGCDSLGKLETTRRYKEFYSLRKVLTSQWPGCSVPQLPPKQKLGNLEPIFIEARRSQLENFLQKLSQIDYFYSSVEVQLFLRGPKDFHKSEVSEKPIDYQLISEKYSSVFKEYLNYKRDSQMEQQIGVILRHLNNGIWNFENLSKLGSEQFELMLQNAAGTERVAKGIIEMRLFLGDSTENAYMKSLENPFLEMVQWCKNSSLVVAEIIESIYTQYELQRMKSQIRRKIDEENLKIQRMSGKKSKFWRALRNEDKCEEKVKSLSRVLEGLEMVLDVTSALVVNKEYPKFKDETKNEFLRILKKMLELCGESFDVIFENFMVGLR